MNQTAKQIAQKALIFAVALGGVIGLISIIPFFIGYSLFVLTLLSAPLVIIFMKKNQIITSLDMKQSAIIGAIIGCFSTAGFFAVFAPLVCVVKFIYRSYYAYVIPEMLNGAMWLFIIIVAMAAFVFALTNSISAMGLNWLYSFF